MTIESNMTKEFIQSGIMNSFITAQKFTESSLNQLGRTYSSVGHYKQKIFTYFALLLPKQLFSKLSYQEMYKYKMLKIESQKKSN